jgi:hypothetical protein
MANPKPKNTMKRMTQKQVGQEYDAINKKIAETGTLESLLNGMYQKRTGLLNLINEAKEEELTSGGKTVFIEKDKVKHLNSQVASNKLMGTEIKNMFPGVVGIAEGARDTMTSFSNMLGPIGKIVAIIVMIAKFAMQLAKDIANVRKDLGVSAFEAFKLHYEFKGLEQVGKVFGLEMSDIKASFKAARDDLGATTDEALGLSLNLAKVAMESGTTASELTTILSTMESVSSASRDVLLNQIEMNRQLIEQAGLAPGDIFSEIAQQTEFFAKFAKDGGDNIIRAGIAAKQLGLDMSAVSSISESLLNFESSIAGQLEASMLLGREINLDRARQLALTGDQEGMMQEILKQVGGEAEFNKMNVLQRKALATSVGVSVEQLSRLVRNNTAGAVGTAAGAAAGRASENVFSNPEGERLLSKIARNTEGL